MLYHPITLHTNTCPTVQIILNANICPTVQTTTVIIITAIFLITTEGTTTQDKPVISLNIVFIVDARIIGSRNVT